MRIKELPNDNDVAESIHSLTDDAVRDMTSAGYFFAARVASSLMYTSDPSPAELNAYAIGMFRYGILWAMWSGFASADPSLMVEGEDKEALRNKRIDMFQRMLGVAQQEQAGSAHNPASYL